MADKDPLSTTTSEVSKRKEERAKRKRERELNDIRKLVSCAEGRRFLWRLFTKSGIYQLTYTGEVNSTNFNEGRRSLGLLILLDLNEANPTAFSQMQREFLSEFNSEQEEE